MTRPVLHGRDHATDVDPIPGLFAPRSFLFVMVSTSGALSTGVKGDVRLYADFVITEWTLLADVSGSIVVDIWRDAYANYPPTDADSITGSTPPTISGATKANSSTLTGWTTAINAGDCLRFNIDSAATITRCTLALALDPVPLPTEPIAV